MKNTLLLLLSISIFSLLSGQTNPDRHSSVAEDSWLSCSTSESPNTDRGTAHWIMYDLGEAYSLSSVKAWNYNHPDHLEYGIQNANVDISIDGTTWADAGTLNIPQSSGNSNYNGDANFDFDGKSGRYILISVESTYGGSCAGLAEMKVEVSQAALPLTLTSFSIECQSPFKPLAQWETENQINVDQFEILASKNLTEWSSIGSKNSGESNGNKAKSKKYSISLNSSSSKFAYFKLKSIDNDGTTYFSDIVLNHCEVGNDFTIGPNPTSGLLTFDDNQVDQMEIYDANGRLVSTYSNLKSRIDIANLNSGIYYINAHIGDKIHSTKIVKN